jgi:hypothetical protein
MSAAVQMTPADEERRIRRGMRFDLKSCARKTRPTLARTLLCGALVFSGGFCLGWAAFRFLRG